MYTIATMENESPNGVIETFDITALRIVLLCESKLNMVWMNGWWRIVMVNNSTSYLY